MKKSKKRKSSIQVKTVLFFVIFVVLFLLMLFAFKNKYLEQNSRNQILPTPTVSFKNIVGLEDSDRMQNIKAKKIIGISNWLNTSNPIALSDLHGKVTLLVFWRLYCEPCTLSLKEVNILQKKYDNGILQIIGIYSPQYDGEKNQQVIEKALRDYAVTYPVAVDIDMKTFLDYDGSFWPSFYLLDKNGYVRYSHYGVTTSESLSLGIEELLHK